MEKTSLRIKKKPIKYSVLGINPSDGKLSELLLREARKAEEKGFIPILVCCGLWCEPCRDLYVGMANKRMIDAFAGVHIVRVDIDDWHGELHDNGFLICSVPHFEYLDGDGRPCDMNITGAAWGEDNTAESMAPHLLAFFDRCRSKVD